MAGHRRPRRLLVACVLLGLTACSATSTPGPGSPQPSTPTPSSTSPSDTQVLFVSSVDTPKDRDARVMVSDVRVAGPDGRGPQTVIPHDARARHVWASADGSVLAYQAQAPSGFSSSVDIWIVSAHGTVRLPFPRRPDTVAVVAPDGHAVYATNGADVVRYVVATGTVSTLCTGCVAWPKGPWTLAVSEDESRVATTSREGGPEEGYVFTVEVTDARTSTRLWSVAGHTLTGWGGGKDEPIPAVTAFVDDSTVVETQCCAADGNAEIHLVSGLGSGHEVDTNTGVHGFGAFTRLRGLWWYYRISWNNVSSIYTNPDLTPAHETKVADRVDGTTSWDYQPVTSRPPVLPELYPVVPTPTMSS